MRSRVVLSSVLLSLVGLTAVSCGENAPPKPAAEGAGVSMSAGSTRTPINASAAPLSNAPVSNAPAPQVEAPPAPPADATTTLMVQDFTGPVHVQEATRAKQEMLRSSGLKAWYVVHQEDRSTLFHGYYKSPNDTTARRDRELIASLHDRLGNNLFRSVVAVPVDAPDPNAPSEWNLANLRKDKSDTRHYYTLQIAAYKDTVERKQAAIESVKAARAQGVEAYYFHGPTASLVCIGCWSIDAIKRDTENRAQMNNANPDQQLLVVTGLPLTKQQESRFMKEAERKNMKVVAPEVIVTDRSLKAAMEQYPYHLINGNEEFDKVTHKPIPRPSLLVLVPPRESSPLTGDGTTTVSAPPPSNNEAIRSIEPAKPTYTPGSGRLRSLDGKK